MFVWPFFFFLLLSFGDQRVENLFLPPKFLHLSSSYFLLTPVFLLFLYSFNGRVVGYLMSDVLSHPFLIPDFEQFIVHLWIGFVLLFFVQLYSQSVSQSVTVERRAL